LPGVVVSSREGEKAEDLANAPAASNAAVPAVLPAFASAPDPGPLLKPISPVARWLWMLLAYVSLGLAIVAVFLPGIPSTEFVLLAAWAASKGSPRLRAWMLGHRVFGPIIHNWHYGRVVTRRAKLGASLSMSVALGVMVWTLPDHRVLVAVLAVGMACGAAWMWSRPERIPEA
jgi:uncharacterized membrane protein YbaN (DUF454 family)